MKQLLIGNQHKLGHSMQALENHENKEKLFEINVCRRAVHSFLFYRILCFTASIDRLKRVFFDNIVLLNTIYC